MSNGDETVHQVLSFVNVTNQVLNSFLQSPLPVYRCETG